jgi:hypothetical protein
VTREELIDKLQAKFLVSSPNKLLDNLQSLGLVSDEAIWIEDCADRDLIAAYFKSLSSFDK